MRMIHSKNYNGKTLTAIYRADVYQQNGDLDRTPEDYNHASRLDPTYAAAYFSRGRIFEKKNDIAKARLKYNKTISGPTINHIAQWARDNARVRPKALAKTKCNDSL